MSGGRWSVVGFRFDVSRFCEQGWQNAGDVRGPEGPQEISSIIPTLKIDKEGTTRAIEGADEENGRFIAIAAQNIPALLAGRSEHLSMIGALRADHLPLFSDEDPDVGQCDDQRPTLYVVVDGALDKIHALLLGASQDGAVAVDNVPGLSVEFRADVEILEPQKLFAELAGKNADDLVGAWGGQPTPHRLPQPGESCEAWCARVALPADRFARHAERWEASGFSLRRFKAFGPVSAEPQAIEWVIEGLLPRGCISTLVGNGGCGKSSLAQEIVAALDSGAAAPCRTVLGQPVTGRNVCAILQGEDGAGVIDDRRRRLATVFGESNYAVFCDPDETIDGLLADFDSDPLDLLVIDPLRYYFEGDEDSSRYASAFYKPLERFARHKNCGVLILQHLVKGRPKSIAQVSGMVRGSGVHTDRTRQQLVMLDRGHGIVEVGITKANFPPELLWAPINEGRRFRRDQATFRLIPLDGGAIAGNHADDASVVQDAICRAVDRLRGTFGVVRRTGKKHGLFELRPEELAGVSRAKVLSGVAELIVAGRLIDAQDGLEVVANGKAGTLGSAGTAT